MAGLSALIAPLLGIVFPIVTTLINLEVQRQVAAELQFQRMLAEYEEQRRRRELIEEVLAELKAEEREALRTVVPGG